MIYLGIDASTQGMKALAMDAEEGVVAAEASVHFGRDLPAYHSPSGFLENPDPLIKQADPGMWLDALELLFFRLKNSGMNPASVAGISGSGQQHGSVCLNSDMAPLQSPKTLAEQIKPLLSRPLAPIWMDHSDSEECRELAAWFGDRIQRDTGSPATERFTGPQIRKFYKESPADYEKTRRIHLVSSFLCSVLCGKDAPIDYGDGAGMNLLNLRTLDWDVPIAEKTAPGLLAKLPDARASHTVAGKLDPYFERYGFRAGIPVAVWSGDNPNSLIGTGAGEPGNAAISLGTSDTFFAAMRDFRTDPDGFGHVFGNPAGGFMSLICFANGSLAREKILEECNVDWKFFDTQACALTPPGNSGILMLPYFEPECTPATTGPLVKYNREKLSGPEKIRAILESQALAMKLHSRWIAPSFSKLRITGGASNSVDFRQILANVFQTKIETISVPNSAALGAAMRAANAIGGIHFSSLYSTFCSPAETVNPDPALKELYERKLLDFQEFQKKTRSEANR